MRVEFMHKTISEKILADHAGKPEVFPDELVEVRVDFAFGNDITAPLAIEAFRRSGAKKVFDRDRIGLIPDHFVPNKDIASAVQARMLRDFAREFDIRHYFEVGRMGVEHALLPEQGLVLPGDVVIGADSHTCTYGGLGAFATGVGSTDLAAAMITGKVWFKTPHSMKFIFRGKLKPWVGGKDLILYTIGRIGVDGARYRAMEFEGEVIGSLSMSDRFSMCNMAIEAGAKVGIVTPDSITEEYVKARAKRPYKFYRSDPGATYEAVYDWDISNLGPGGDRLVHQRAPRRFADCRPNLKRQKGRARGSLPGDTRNPTHLHGSHGRGTHRDLHRGRSRGQHSHLRPLPWRPHGHSGSRRVCRGDDQPQLRWPHGTRGQQGLSEQSRGCCRLRRPRSHSASRRGIELMKITGKTWKFGNDVDTDAIIPARYLNTTDPAALASHCMEDADAAFASTVKPGDIIAAGKNFGCGSSREHAPIAIKASGVSCVVAHSFARIFYRNALNMGLAILECPEGADRIQTGDELEIDLDAGVIQNLTKKEKYTAQAIPPFMQKLIKAGGLMEYVKEQMSQQA
jgi:3-isopropylmalate dehydratase small subunit